MAEWQAGEAGERFSDMVSAADASGPQLVMRHGEPVAVVLSPEDYRRLVRQADASFARLLELSPFSPEDMRPVGMNLSAEA